MWEVIVKGWPKRTCSLSRWVQHNYPSSKCDFSKSFRLCLSMAQKKDGGFGARGLSLNSDFITVSINYGTVMLSNNQSQNLSTTIRINLVHVFVGQCGGWLGRGSTELGLAQLKLLCFTCLRTRRLGWWWQRWKNKTICKSSFKASACMPSAKIPSTKQVM